MVNKIELIFLEEKIVKNCKYIFAILLLPLDYECWPSFELLVTWISLVKNTLFKFWIFFFAQHFWRKDYFKIILICRRHIDQNDVRHTLNTQVYINSYHTYIIRYLICRPIDFDICFSINYSKHAETPKLYRYSAWIKYVDVTHRLSAWITSHLSNDIFLSFIQAIIKSPAHETSLPANKLELLIYQHFGSVDWLIDYFGVLLLVDRISAI